MSARASRTPWLELAVAAGGAIAVLSMVGYLLFDAYAGGRERPADIVMERSGTVALSAGWRVSVRVRNLGDRPARAVALEAELTLPDGETERAGLTVAFLPPRGSLEAAFVFARDPDVGELRLRTLGHLVP